MIKESQLGNKIKEWCKYHRGYIPKGKRWACCHCRKYEYYYQVGDGKLVHSLCKDCYKKITSHFCGGEKAWKKVCKECQDERCVNPKGEVK